MINLMQTSPIDFYFNWDTDDPVFQEIDAWLPIENKQGVDFELYDSHWPQTPEVVHLVFLNEAAASEFVKRFKKPEAGYQDRIGEESEWIHNYYNNDDFKAMRF